MRAAGKLARQVLDLAGRAVQVGVTTDEIDAIVHQAIVEVSIEGDSPLCDIQSTNACVSFGFFCCCQAGAYPSPLNYH